MLLHMHQYQTCQPPPKIVNCVLKSQLPILIYLLLFRSTVLGWVTKHNWCHGCGGGFIGELDPRCHACALTPPSPDELQNLGIYPKMLNTAKVPQNK